MRKNIGNVSRCLWFRRPIARVAIVELTLMMLLTTSRGLGAEPEALAARTENPDLLQLSFEDLGKITVTSVSRKSESLSGAAGAIHVITQEDIRRSGVTSLPEVLRMAPGLEVARPNSRQWAISARGFNDTFANKLLVLMDGRTLYTPLFSGVLWEEMDTALEDIDRIEVIRGPGATQWGANAVNGVINIVTKSAKETQGTLISGGGGLEERAFGTVRYGGQLATNAYYRVYAKYADRDEFTKVAGGGDGEAWSMAQGGFRMDWEASPNNRLTLQGDYYRDHLGGPVYRSSLTPPQLAPVDYHDTAEGANILGRWTHEFSADSDLSVQMFYDRTDRGFGVGRELRDTADLDTQFRFHLGDRHEIVSGAGYRYSADNITESEDFKMRDPSVGLHLVSAFVQDQVALVPDRLQLTLGTKVEHNDFTGFEVQPSVRMAWTPHARHTLWGAVSRAARTPSRVERDASIFAESIPLGPVGILFPVEGNPNFRSEELIAYEIGYRATIHPRLTVDWTAYYNDYDNLRSLLTLPLELRSSPSPYLAVPYLITNDLFGKTYGTEVIASWQPMDSWRLRCGYTLLETEFETRGSARSVIQDFEEGANPQHQLFLQSDVEFGQHIEWGVGLRYVDRLPYYGISDYTEMEMRLAWKPNKHVELALVGRNLLQAHHRESSPLIIAYRNAEADRAVYAKLTLRF